MSDKHKHPFFKVVVNDVYLNDYEHTTYKAARKHALEMVELLELIDGITFSIHLTDPIECGLRYERWTRARKEPLPGQLTNSAEYSSDETFRAMMKEKYGFPRTTTTGGADQ